MNARGQTDVVEAAAAADEHRTFLWNIPAGIQMFCCVPTATPPSWRPVLTQRGERWEESESLMTSAGSLASLSAPVGPQIGSEGSAPVIRRSKQYLPTADQVQSLPHGGRWDSWDECGRWRK